MLLFIHPLSFFASLLRQKKVRALRNAGVQRGTKICIVYRMIVKACSALCSKAQVGPLFKVMVLYFIFEEDAERFKVRSLRVNSFATIMQSKSSQKYSKPLSSPNGVEPEAYGKIS